ECGGFAFEPLVRPVEVRFVDVTDGGNLNVVELYKGVEKLRTAIADADETHADFFIGPVHAPRRGGGEGQGRRGGSESAASHGARRHGSTSWANNGGGG